MTILNSGQRDTLEAMVDAVGVPEVLFALARVVGEKASHVEANWQDTELARLCDRAAAIIEAAGARVSRVGLP